MSVVGLSDYKLLMVEKICADKFENDIMLVFNNFSNHSISYITNLIKEDIRNIEDKGVVFDSKLIKISCTMYLGICWSMYKKGKIIQREKNLIDRVTCDNSYDDTQEIVTKFLKGSDYMTTINDIALRYFTLYLSRYLSDIMDRMEISYHPSITDEKVLKKLFLEHLRGFAVKTLTLGILDEGKRSFD